MAVGSTLVVIVLTVFGTSVSSSLIFNSSTLSVDSSFSVDCLSIVEILVKVTGSVVLDLVTLEWVVLVTLAKSVVVVDVVDFFVVVFVAVMLSFFLEEIRSLKPLRMIVVVVAWVTVVVSVGDLST